MDSCTRQKYLAALPKILLTALLYGLSIIPGKMLLMLVPGAEVRFAACIPVITGFLWGPAGAIGSALGNFIGDFYSGDALFVCFWGAVCNFFLAFLPYKLWYGVRAQNAPLFIYDTQSCIKFFAIIFLTALNFAALLTGITISAGMLENSRSFFIFFSSNFNFPLLFGLPILLYLRRQVNFSLPSLPQTAVPKHSWQIYIFAFASLSSVSFLLYAFNGATAEVALAFLVTNALLLAYVCTLPAAYDSELLSLQTKNYHSISAKATSLLMLLAVAIICFTILLAYFIQRKAFPDEAGLSLWQSLFTTLLISSNIIFLAIFLLLHRMEQALVLPLRQLTHAATTLVSSGYLEEQQHCQQIAKAYEKNQDEISDLWASFNQMSCDIRSYIDNMAAAIAEKENIAAQLSVASQIQQSILPDTAPINQQLKNYTVTAGMFPAKEVGGDMYDCFFLPDGRLAILIADVSGKGMPAALFMMAAKTLLKSNGSLGDPAKILSAANDSLAENNTNMMFVTVWLGIVDLVSGKMVYANAGHNYPLLQEENKPGVWLRQRSGPALGIITGRVYKNYELTLPFNSKLLLYTDGITEAENPRKEFYGEQRLEQRFQRAHIPEDILFSVLEFAEYSPQSDDITFLWLSRK